MKEKELFLLLNTIKNNTDVKRLVREGINYSDIARLTNEAITSGYISYENEKVQLSAFGELTYLELEGNYKRTNKNEWIEKDLKSRIAKIDKKAIFVPLQSELTFKDLY